MNTIKVWEPVTRAGVGAVVKPLSWLWLAAAVGACAPDNSAEGTAVGNLNAFRLNTPIASDVASVEGTVSVTDAAIVDCEGGTSPLAAGVALSLVGGSTLGIPNGTWCGVQLMTDQPAVWTGASTAGHTFTISVAVNQLAVGSATPFDANTPLNLVWQLGRTEWLNADDLGADDEDVIIPPDDSRARKALEEISGGQFLFDDDDDDLLADDDEDDLSTPEDEGDDDKGGARASGPDEDPPDTARGSDD